MMTLHDLIAVTATAEPDVYIAQVDITDVNGERYVTEYGSRSGDTFGLAPLVRAAVEQWLEDERPVSPYVPALPPVPQIISRRQFYQGLATAGLITKEEALAALTGALPPALSAIIGVIPDEDAAFAATAHLLASGEFDRAHPLIPVFAASQGMSDTDVDDFWRLCASLV